MDPTIAIPSRFITDHDEDGRSVFNTDVPESLSFYNAMDDVENPVGFALAYTTSRFPTPLARNQDLIDYKAILANPKATGISKHGGIVMRCIDYPPGFVSPMHRTRSSDVGILISGQIECVLDSGERKLLRNAGDITIQRSTMHAWSNPSVTTWARMYYILIDAEAITHNGKELTEDLGGIDATTSH